MLTDTEADHQPTVTPPGGAYPVRCRSPKSANWAPASKGAVAGSGVSVDEGCGDDGAPGGGGARRETNSTSSMAVGMSASERTSVSKTAPPKLTKLAPAPSSDACCSARSASVSWSFAFDKATLSSATSFWSKLSFSLSKSSWSWAFDKAMLAFASASLSLRNCWDAEMMQVAFEPHRVIFV